MTSPSPLLGLAATLVLLGASVPAVARSQALPVGDRREEYLRILQVAGKVTTGSFTIRPMKASGFAGADGDDPWGVLAEVRIPGSKRSRWPSGWNAELRSFVNSSMPHVQNDGFVWQGRGLTTALDVGGHVVWGPVSLSLQPAVAWAANRAFDLPFPTRAGDSVYLDPWAAADLPVRMGPGALTIVDPGQSGLRVAFRGLSLGGGTENLWWGPGTQNAILMTNNAAGFLHADLRTDRPVNLGFANVEGQWLWGHLDHSRWFARDSLPGGRFMTGMVLAFTPHATPGLTIGASRMFQQRIPDSGVPWQDYFLIFQRVQKKAFDTPSNPGGRDLRDQLASIFGRWVFPEVGFELYGEWGRNDHATDYRDYYTEPEHSSAYTIGLRKVSDRGPGKLLSVNFEATHLERSNTRTVRETPTWYTHGIVRQGYTQRGQVIGAGIGPGGDSQYLGVAWYHRRGMTGASVQRRTINNDAFYELTPPGLFKFAHRTATDLGAQWLFFAARDLDVDLGVTMTSELNRYYVYRNDVWNAHLQAAIRWRPR